MAELIYKKSALNALSDASYGNFNYVTARNAIDCVPTTTESEIRAKAYDKVCNAISNLLSGDTKHLEGGAYYKELAYIEVLRMVEQLKEE